MVRVCKGGWGTRICTASTAHAGNSYGSTGAVRNIILPLFRRLHHQQSCEFVLSIGSAPTAHAHQLRRDGWRPNTGLINPECIAQKALTTVISYYAGVARVVPTKACATGGHSYEQGRGTERGGYGGDSDVLV
ncbi:hypothetical protein BJV74DRAFT_481056 [Russula compacta]|nr:hypothetical protein BJV74DRAFT_481056 [Russula compacta]